MCRVELVLVVLDMLACRPKRRPTDIARRHSPTTWPTNRARGAKFIAKVHVNVNVHPGQRLSFMLINHRTDRDVYLIRS